MIRLLAALMLLGPWTAAAGVAQPAPQGAPFSVTHFTAQEYRAQPQNWSVAQDARGLIYVANNDGILQYDGARWRLIETDANTFVRSVAADSQGTVYAGGVGDFGVLRPDSTATLRYVSLSERLPQEQRDFGDVWYTHATDEGVYFQSRKRLFRWNGDTLRSWQSEEEAFHTSFVVRGQLYVRESGRGLLRMDSDSLKLVPGGERFAGVSVFVMVPHGRERILIGTRTDDLLLYDGRTFAPFPTQVDPLLEETRLYHGCTLPGGEVALATLGGGVLIIDREGRLVQVLNRDTALPDGMVNHVYPDGQGGLWMALNNQGVARAEVSSPLSRFGERFGLEGVVEDLHRHEGTLYAATGAGVYALRRQGAGAAAQRRFESVPGVPAAWNLLSAGGTLYAATSLGVYRVEEGGGTALVQRRTFSLAAAEAAPERLYVGTGEGLGLLQREGGGWAFRLLAPTESEVRSVAATDGGALWFSTLGGAVLRLPAAEALVPQNESARPQGFGPSDGLPSGKGGGVTTFRDQPAFVSKEGLYRLRRTAGDTSFYADTTVTGPPDASDPLLALYEASDSGEAWLFYEDRIKVARRQPGGTYVRTAPPALQFPRSAVVRAEVDADGSAWISSRDELIYYDAPRAERLRNAEINKAEPAPLIRQVRDVATGAVLYGGAARPEAPPDAPVEIPYRQNTLAIQFALPQYGGDVPPMYQYRLEGEDEWSAWTPDAYATFGGLYEGSYTFQVRARGEENASVARTSLTLRVLPPWYRTPWAYLSYLVGAVLLTAGYRHYRHLKKESLRAQRQERELKQERQARARLQEANTRLEQANRLKENFLANTSHEFRTPLASIMGYAEVLQSEDLPREQRNDFLGIIRRSGNRLLNTVDMLLEIAQLRAGTLNLKPSRVDVNEEIETAVLPLRADAAEKGLDFHVDASGQPLHAWLPASYFRRIVENLVDNAVKFTPEGAVCISAQEAGSSLLVKVRDTGVGMEEAEAERLFGEFKQGSEGISREYEGIGLGLTIAARLAHLMGGAIEVESEKGEGSTFTVRLPKNTGANASTNGSANASANAGTNASVPTSPYHP